MSISESGSLYESTNLSHENAATNQSNSSRNVRNTSTSSSALITRSRGNFPPILYKILAMNYVGIITWQPGGESFRIHSRWRLEDEVLPHYFRHKKFSSFQKQLSIYDFTHTPQSLAHESSYRHRYFKQGREDLIPLIIRVPSRVVQSITIMSTDSTSLIEDDSSDDGEDDMAITSLSKSKSKSSKTTTDMKSTSSSYSSIENKESNHSTHVKTIPSNSPGSNHSYDISNSGSLSGITTQSSFVPLSVMIRGRDQTYHQVYQLVEPVPPSYHSTTTNNSSTTACTYTQQAIRQVAPQFPPTNQRSLLNSVSQEVTPPTTATTTATATSNSPIYIKDLSSVIGNIVNDVLSTHTQNLKYSQSPSSTSSILPEINSNTSYMQTSPSYTTCNSLNRNTYSHDHMSHTHDIRHTAPTNGSGCYNASRQDYTTVPIQSTSAVSTAASSPIYTVNLSTLIMTMNEHISELFTNLSQQYLQLSISQWQQLYFDVMNAINQSIVGYIQNNTTTYMTSDNQDHSIEYIDPIKGYNNQPYTQYIGDNTMYIRQSLHYPYTYPRNYSDTNYNDSTTNYYTQPIMTHDDLSTPYYISAYSHLYNTHPTTTPMASKHSIDSEDTPGIHSTYVQSNTTSNNMRTSSNTYNTTTTQPQFKPPNITTNMSHQSGGISITSMSIDASSKSLHINSMNKGTKRKYNVLPK